MAERPPKAYAATIGTYLVLFSTLAALIWRRKKLDETPPARDLAMLGIATFRFSRLIAYDRVTQVFRLPFVETGEGYQQIEGTQEQPTGTGIQRTIGQLLTCSWCTSVWAGTFNVGVYALVPHLGRFWNMMLMASGISELLDPLFPLLNFLAGFIQKKEELLKQELQAQDR